jgi:hypothetical protein
VETCWNHNDPTDLVLANSGLKRSLGVHRLGRRLPTELDVRETVH